MSVLSPPWPSQAQPRHWPSAPHLHASGSFSALAAPVVPPPLTTHHSHSFSGGSFSALAAPVIPFTPGPFPATPAPPPVPPKNSTPLTRELLLRALEYLSTLLPHHFGAHNQVRLVIHGGAAMLLFSELAQMAASTAALDAQAQAQRTTTRDIDYIARSFATEWAQRGVFDAVDRLRACIVATARQFGFGADWMNSDPDVALPWATDPTTNRPYDPIHRAAVEAEATGTVFTSRNGLLKLVSVTPLWTVALKMVRFNAADRADICILLRSGTRVMNLHWTPARLEAWLLGTCWAMGYATYNAERVMQMRQRMVQVVDEVNRWDPDAVRDDGRGGVVPLRPRQHSQSQMEMAMYPPTNYVSPQQALYPVLPAAPFGLPQAASPLPHSMHKAEKKAAKREREKERELRERERRRERDRKAVTTWPSAWTTPAPAPVSSTSYYGYTPPGYGYVPPDPQPELELEPEWDPVHTKEWNDEVRSAARKGRVPVPSWVPFFRKGKDKVKEKWRDDQPRRRPAVESDSESESESEEETDTDSDEEDLAREQAKWVGSQHLQGVAPPPGASASHASVADFMSNGSALSGEGGFGGNDVAPAPPPADVLAPAPPPAAPAPAPPLTASASASGPVIPGWNVVDPNAGAAEPFYPPSPPLPPIPAPTTTQAQASAVALGPAHRTHTPHPHAQPHSQHQQRLHAHPQQQPIVYRSAWGYVYPPHLQPRMSGPGLVSQPGAQMTQAQYWHQQQVQAQISGNPSGTGNALGLSGV